MPVFIQSAEAISPQDTFQPSISQAQAGKAQGIEFRPLPGEGYHNCIHPDYKQYINPTALRRMSPLIRMGLATSKICVEKAGIEKPDAILVGSGLGCVRDTVKFLNQLIENQETLLNPTAFIQSTHNTVSGQIALMLGCRAHNLTFSQDSISFQTALLEGMLLLDEDKAKNILLGGIDEVVEESFQLMDKNGCVNGPMGEGSNFFLISSEQSAKSMARLDGLQILNRCEPGDVSKLTSDFLVSRGLAVDDIDLLISGRNAEEKSGEFYTRVEQLFHPSKLAEYKHLVGEYNTASAFAMWLATGVIRDNYVPDVLLSGRSGNRDDAPQTRPIRRVLLFNQNKGRNFSWILLSHPDT